MSSPNLLPQVLQNISNKISTPELQYNLDKSFSDIVQSPSPKNRAQQLQFLEKNLGKLRLEEQSLQIENQQLRKQLMQCQPDSTQFQQLILQKQKEQKDKITEQRQTIVQYKQKIEDIKIKCNKAKKILQRLEQNKQKTLLLLKLQQEYQEQCSLTNELQNELKIKQDKLAFNEKEIQDFQRLKDTFEENEQKIDKIADNINELKGQDSKNGELIAQMNKHLQQLHDMLNNNCTDQVDQLRIDNIKQRMKEIHRQQTLEQEQSDKQTQLYRLSEYNNELIQHIQNFFNRVKDYSEEYDTNAE